MNAGPDTLTVLVLGGTAEARALAAALAGCPGLRVVSSLAGRVSNPALPEGEVRVGGFGVGSPSQSTTTSRPCSRCAASRPTVSS